MGYCYIDYEWIVIRFQGFWLLCTLHTFLFCSSLNGEDVSMSHSGLYLRVSVCSDRVSSGLSSGLTWSPSLPSPDTSVYHCVPYFISPFHLQTSIHHSNVYQCNEGMLYGNSKIKPCQLCLFVCFTFFALLGCNFKPTTNICGDSLPWIQVWE